MKDVLLRRSFAVIVPAGDAHTPLPVLATMQKNLEAFGCSLSPALFARLATLGTDRVIALYHDVSSELQRMLGAHRPIRPLYPDFPAQVMALPEAQLYCNALLHYLGLADQFGLCTPRPPLQETTSLRRIELAPADALETLYGHLLRAKSPYSPQDRDDLATLFAQQPDLAVTLLPETVSCKENLAVIAAQLLRAARGDANGWLDRNIRTATDVLRIAAALSDGDVSLAAATKFTRLRRIWRVRLLGWVENAGNALEDMQRWTGRWLRLGERLHPGEYAGRFPAAAEAFRALRNGERSAGFAAQVETALTARAHADALRLLQQRPGELARRLDHLARTGDAADVIAAFANCADAVSTTVLLQVMTHFRRRDQTSPLRVFFPKGEVGKLFATEDRRAPVGEAVATAFASLSERALLRRFAQRPPLGRSYVDPQLRHFLVPFSQRSAAKALRTLVRGSRMPLPDCSTLRFFLWWRNAEGRVDIDLSAALYADDYAHISTLAYYNLRNFGAHHSGDIVDAPAGASEFIDIDLQRCRKAGVRYVVMSVNNYTQQAFCDLPECFAGWMARQAPASGEIYEPATVHDRFDLAADTRICLPILFDIQAGEAIWCDIALKRHPRYVNNVHNNLAGVSLMLRAMTQLRKTDLHTLFDLHVRARGEAVADPDRADTVFAVDAGLRPTDLDVIAAQFL